jgi:hypothetical protein
VIGTARDAIQAVAELVDIFGRRTYCPICGHSGQALALGDHWNGCEFEGWLTRNHDAIDLAEIWQKSRESHT